jgi:hypothetical protein
MERRIFLKMLGLLPIATGLAAWTRQTQKGENFIAADWMWMRKDETALNPDGMGTVTLGSETKFTAYMARKPLDEIDLVTGFYRGMTANPGEILFPADSKLASGSLSAEKKRMAKYYYTRKPLKVLAARWQIMTSPTMSLLVAGEIGDTETPPRQGVAVLDIKRGDANLRELKLESLDSTLDSSRRKAMETIQIIVNRIQRDNTFGVPRDKILQAAIVPGKYDVAYRSSIRDAYIYQILLGILEKEGGNLSNCLVPGYFENPALVLINKPSLPPQPDVYLPIGAKMDILGLARGDGKVFALTQLQQPIDTFISRATNPEPFSGLVEVTFQLPQGEFQQMWVPLDGIQAQVDRG